MDEDDVRLLWQRLQRTKDGCRAGLPARDDRDLGKGTAGVQKTRDVLDVVGRGRHDDVIDGVSRRQGANGVDDERFPVKVA